MPSTPRSLHRVLLPLAFAAACGPSTPPPEGGVEPERTGQRSGVPRVDTLRRNTVIENARPEVATRAGMLVVANQEGASATVIDAATMQTIATVPVGAGPHEVAVSPDGRWAVVTIYGMRGEPGHSLAVLDLAASPIANVRTIELGEYRRPHGAAFVGAGQKLVVTSEATQRLVMIDFASGRIDTALATNGRGSHMVAVRRDGRRAWTANIGDGTVTEFDLERRTTGRTYAAAAMDEAIAATPGGLLLWVGSNSAKTVTIIDSEKREPTGTIAGFGMPYRIGISRTGRVAVVSDPVSDRVWIYEVGSNRKLAEIALDTVKSVKKVAPTPAPTPADPSATDSGAGPEGITFDPIADFAYLSLHRTSQVIGIDLGQLKVVSFGTTGAGPDGIAFSPVPRRP